ncbi:flagellar basal body-associated FliL family protein [Sporichthya polymorpha]|uniref:flagellar basal body-associated FliL family protein n=1 Tax=Sporichthya polymorpha TaxID=35751 RepID=UPI001FE1DA46|nr:flagellar basal body-associated FliL family protein [Sporichthya polymorpha]
MATPTASRPASADGVRDAQPDRGASRTPSEPAESEPAGRKGSTPKSKKKLFIVLAVVLALGAGTYTFLKPAPATSGAPEPGAVVKLDPVTLNLDAGRYLKVGLALQFTAVTSAGGGHGGGADGEPDGSKALDLVIEQLSNRKAAELNTAVGREAAKDALLAAVAEAYHGDVMDIYFTQFVMQ